MLFIFLLLFFLCLSTHLCFAADTLSAGESLYQVETLVSAGGNFELGFFTPGASSNYYIAIWYKKISVRSKTPVWVANRDNPFSDPSSTGLKLLEDGNLVILNQSKEPIWTTNLTSKAKNTPELVLGDDGNLVLRDGSNSSLVLWQSFDHPTDTWLPGGKLRYDFRTKSPTPLTSWKNSENPAQGMFNMQMDPVVQQYLILQNGSTEYWTSGPWDGQIFSLVPEMRLNYIYNFSFVSNEVESYFTYDVFNRSIYSRFVMSLSGQVSQLVWLENTESWNLIWSQPRRQCEVHAICGAFSTCNEMVSPLCQCFPGFQPLSLRDWNLKDSSGGCVRNSTLQCGDKDKFWLMANMKLPENAVRLNVGSEKECMLNCLKDCSCVAYNYRSGCSIWTEAMLNIEPLSNDDGERRDLYLKLAVSEIRILRGEKNGSDHKKDVTVVIVITVIAGMLFLGFLLYVSWRWSAKQRGKNKDVVNLDFGRSNDTSKFSDTCKFGDNSELPIFDFEKLTIATNHFDSAHKLGQGGFGPVYKGILSDGQEIAVKRLSKSSGQGLVEFKNEVVVISKLQHRNLVRLLGCCIQGEEKMLIYEYMPNKSLDYFIFDSTKQSLLDWSKRFEIIMGICRGILYLHRDSRLRVIHRDLKASNILLDHDLKPKISDFGMARIFGGDELQANTLRVVGTYGYMSPEYAMKGVFSEKSDVYSFGVLLLELVSGKRNSTFYHHEQFWTLLGYAWKLWTEGKTQELIDPAILGSCNQEEVVRCILVGLLCVQDFAKNRPTMPSVISMLTSETPNLSIPEQPIFTGKEVTSDTDLSQESRKKFSRNNLSFTIMGGR